MNTATFRTAYDAQQEVKTLLAQVEGKYVEVNNEGITICFEYAPRREEEISQAAELLRSVFPRLTSKVIRRKNGRWTEIRIALQSNSQQSRVYSVTH